MPSGLQPGRLAGRHDALDHVAAGRDDQDALARAVLGLDDVERLEVQHRAVERHRDLVLGLEADRGLQLLAILQRRKLQDADDDLLVRDADANLLVEALVFPVQRAQRVGECVDVVHLAVADDAGLQRRRPPRS